MGTVVLQVDGMGSGYGMDGIRVVRSIKHLTNHKFTKLTLIHKTKIYLTQSRLETELPQASVMTVAREIS